MRRQYLSLLLVLSFVFTSVAQTARVVRTDAGESGLRRHVEYLASEKLEGRRTGTPGATAAAGYIANVFAKLRLKPGARTKAGKATFLQPYTYMPAPPRGASPSDAEAMKKPVNGYNVVGVLDGRDKDLRSEAIIVGAHFDHLGRGGRGSLAANSTEIHHGADDNASGTAAMLELAAEFAKAKNNKRTLIFVGFSGEEDGLFGSKHFVNEPIFPIEKTVAMINLDMVGRLSERKLTIGGVGTASEWKELIQTLNVAESIAASSSQAGNGSTNGMANHRPLNRFDLVLNEDGFGPSDHASFYTKQIPVLFFFTGTHLDYHKPSDTSEKINYEGLTGIVSFVSSIIKSVDQKPVRPTYTTAKSTAAAGGRASFNVSLGTIPGYADSDDGMMIDGVRDDSPAAKAGLKGGDKIVKLAGVEIKNINDYMKALGVMKAGDEYDISIRRGGETLTLKIVPAPATPR